ncbi:sugar-binding protein [Streptomyces ruber]|uniref:Sugar-binding protein n=2 Tax=Streptomyces TaxID=1883 RepID=A0A918BAZ3_9ACTN|nr:glutamate ABC transporter substrate-binding protein [Streptomyces ruber]GGQ55448.1 sugar-binding protein [Streptomyces ruber]
MSAIRRLGFRTKGWGGVGAMVVACALTAALALLPLRGAGGSGGTGTGGAGTTRVTYTKAETCEHPEKRSPAPSADESGPAVQEIKRRGYLIVGVDQNSFGWGYRDPNSEKGGAGLEGFDIDLAQEIADEILGKREDNIRFLAVTTDQRFPAVRDGTVDMVVRTVTITCTSMQEDVAFSAPYFRTGLQVLAPRDSPIEGYDETLANGRVCAAEGSVALNRLRGDKRNGKAVSVPNQLDCLVRLQLGQADAVVTDGALAAGLAAQDPTVALKGDPFTDDYYGVAMRQGADDLVRRVNQVLADYRDDGWRASYKRWLAKPLGGDASKSLPPEPEYR